MKTFNYSFLKENKLSSDILSLYIAIERIKGITQNNKIIYPQVFKSIQKIANFQSVKFSNLLDGILISDSKLQSLDEIKHSTSNNEYDSLIGYRKVLADINENGNKYQLNTYNIRDFHEVLYSLTDSIDGGSFKQQDNMFMEILDDGAKKVIFSPVSSDETSKALEQLVLAYKIARDDDSIPKLLLIPCVILDFLLIYPFNDGNERMSRLLSSLLLYRNDYKVGKFVSFEKQIYKDKSEYYEAIRKSSVNWDDNNNDYNLFIENFLGSLYSCYIELNSRFKIVDGEKKSKKIRIRETIMKSFEPISRKEIHLVWPDISHETIKKVIKNLLNDNKIKKIGKFKDARYKRNWYGSTTLNEENVVIF